MRMLGYRMRGCARAEAMDTAIRKIVPAFAILAGNESRRLRMARMQRFKPVPLIPLVDFYTKKDQRY